MSPSVTAERCWTAEREGVAMKNKERTSCPPPTAATASGTARQVSDIASVPQCEVSEMALPTASMTRAHSLTRVLGSEIGAATVAGQGVAGAEWGFRLMVRIAGSPTVLEGSEQEGEGQAAAEDSNRRSCSTRDAGGEWVIDEWAHQRAITAEQDKEE